MYYCYSSNCHHDPVHLTHRRLSIPNQSNSIGGRKTNEIRRRKVAHVYEGREKKKAKAKAKEKTSGTASTRRKQHALLTLLLLLLRGIVVKKTMIPMKKRGSIRRRISTRRKKTHTRARAKSLTLTLKKIRKKKSRSCC